MCGFQNLFDERVEGGLVGDAGAAKAPVIGFTGTGGAGKSSVVDELVMRLRRDAPVHYCAESAYGAYWSVTTFDEIVQVEKNPEVFRQMFLLILFTVLIPAPA